MVVNCVAYGCTHVQKTNEGIPFHTFPFKRPEVLALWIKAIRRDNWYPSKTSRICGRHFLETDYLCRPGLSNKLLKRNAVPNVFSFSTNLLHRRIANPKLLLRQDIDLPSGNMDTKEIETTDYSITISTLTPIASDVEIKTETCYVDDEYKFQTQQQIESWKQKIMTFENMRTTFLTRQNDSNGGHS